MNINRILSLFWGLLIITSCQSKIEMQSECKIDKVKKLYSDPGYSGDSLIGYSHILIFEDFKRNCLDSILVHKFLVNYIDTSNQGRPIMMIQIYNSDKRFIKNESAQTFEIKKDELVCIWIDPVSKTPYKYTFYNSDGEEIYEGKKWNWR